MSTRAHWRAAMICHRETAAAAAGCSFLSVFSFLIAVRYSTDYFHPEVPCSQALTGSAWQREYRSVSSGTQHLNAAEQKKIYGVRMHFAVAYLGWNPPYVRGSYVCTRVCLGAGMAGLCGERGWGKEKGWRERSSLATSCALLPTLMLPWYHSNMALPGIDCRSSANAFFIWRKFNFVDLESLSPPHLNAWHGWNGEPDKITDIWPTSDPGTLVFYWYTARD